MMEVKGVLESNDDYAIVFGQTVYLQRKSPKSASDKPIGGEEAIIVALCKAIVEQKSAAAQEPPKEMYRIKVGTSYGKPDYIVVDIGEIICVGNIIQRGFYWSDADREYYEIVMRGGGKLTVQSAGDLKKERARLLEEIEKYRAI